MGTNNVILEESFHSEYTALVQHNTNIADIFVGS